jgi:hypothetical protein
MQAPRASRNFQYIFHVKNFGAPLRLRRHRVASQSNRRGRMNSILFSSKCGVTVASN